MKRIFGLLTVAAFAGMLFAANAFAASSGNFSAVALNAQCRINDASGGFIVPSASLKSGVAGHVFEIGSEGLNVNIANGSGTTLIVSPSLVTGLFTDNKISSGFPTSIQDVGIQVQVTVSPNPGTVVGPGDIKIAPTSKGEFHSVCSGGTDAGFSCDAGSGACISGGGTCMLTGATCVPETGVGGDPASGPNAVAACVIYDERFISISSQVLASLSGCTAISASTVSGLNTCFELIESTLSAHDFNFYVQAPGGSYNFDVDAQLFVGVNNTIGAGSVAGCAGPGTVTVVQVKNFSFNSTLTF